MNKHDTNRALAIARKHTPYVDPEPATMPPWRDNARAIPNAIARSSIFRGISARHDRRMLRNEPIPALDGLDVAMTGEELSETDGDAWLQLIHLTRGEPLDKPIVTCGYELLKMLDSGASSKDYKRLKASLRRLQSAQLVLKFQIKNRNVEYIGNLISEITFCDEGDTGRTEWEIRLNKKLVQLFAADVYTKLDWTQRKDLAPLAKWLHAFYSTHPQPFAYKVQTLYDLCGSAAGELRTFRQSLKLALEQLVEREFLVKFDIDPRADLVTVLRVGQAKVAGPVQGGLL